MYFVGSEGGVNVTVLCCEVGGASSEGSGGKGGGIGIDDCGVDTVDCDGGGCVPGTSDLGGGGGAGTGDSGGRGGGACTGDDTLSLTITISLSKVIESVLSVSPVCLHSIRVPGTNLFFLL